MNPSALMSSHQRASHREAAEQGGRPNGNLLYDLLPHDVRSAWTADADLVHLVAGHSVQTAGRVLFPVTAVIAVVNADGARGALLALAGREGMVGASCVMRGPMADWQATVQAEGSALRLDESLFMAAFHEVREVREVVLRYLHALFVQVAHGVLCNRFHAPEAQLCKLLLQLMDRYGGSHLHMTQDQLARLLGLRRETVSRAATQLQQQGAVLYQRGHIRVLDRAAVESHACSCYRQVESACRGLYGGQQDPWAVQGPIGPTAAETTAATGATVAPVAPVVPVVPVTPSEPIEPIRTI